MLSKYIFGTLIFLQRVHSTIYHDHYWNFFVKILIYAASFIFIPNFSIIMNNVMGKTKSLLIKKYRLLNMVVA